MNRILFLTIAALLFTGCAHKIVRSGYEVEKSDYRQCEVVIKKNFILPDSMATKVGEIYLDDSGVSVSCSEEHAIGILKGEACAINANLILITEEKRADMWSSCYRCKAEFYTYNIPEEMQGLKSDDEYNSMKVQDRVSDDRSKNTGIVVGSVVVGFLIGFLLFM